MKQSAHNKYEQEKADDTATSAVDTMAPLEDMIPGSLPEARDAIEAIIDDVVGAVQSRPLLTIAIAAIVGYAFATATK